jgi:hypothetical protein
MWIEVEIPQENKKEWRVIAANKIFRTCHNQKYSAPTLQEITANMPYCRVYKKTANFYVAVKEKDRVVSFNGATATLKLWLKLKGIDYENSDNQRKA